jgi:micrococcal nuclease
MKKMTKKKTNEMWKSPAGIVSIILVLLALVGYNLFVPEEESEPSRSGLIPVELVKTIDGLSL